MQNRSIHRTQTGFARVKTRLQIDDDPSDKGTDAAAKRLVQFLKELADSPEYLMCGNVLVQNIAIRHDGSRWVLTGESEEASNLDR